MSYIITDFQEIENLDYKNSTEINEKLSKNSELFIDKIAKKLNDSSSDLKFKIFLKEEADKLFNTWKTLKNSKDIKNVEVKDLYVNSYWHTYKSLEIKYKDLTNGIFKDYFDTFPDDEKYNRERLWNNFSNFNNTLPSKSSFIKKSKKPKWEYVFEAIIEGRITTDENMNNPKFFLDGIPKKNITVLGDKLSEVLGIDSLRPYFTDSVGHGGSKNLFTIGHKDRMKEIMEKKENKMCKYFQNKLDEL